MQVSRMEENCRDGQGGWDESACGSRVKEGWGIGGERNKDG